MKKIILLAFSFYFIISSAAANTQCPPGQNYNSQVHRCLTSEQTAKMKEAIKSKCNGLEGEAFNKCYYSTALETLEGEGIASSEKYEGSSVGIPIASVATLMTGYYLLRKGQQCKALSLQLMFAAGVVSLLGEIGANITYRSMLKKDIKDYKESISGIEGEKSAQTQIEDSEQNQLKAFDFLIEQEKSKRTALQVRGGAYAATGGLYAGAVVAAIAETIKSSMGSDSSCRFSSNEESITPDENLSPEEYQKILDEATPIYDTNSGWHRVEVEKQIQLNKYTNINRYIFTNEYRYKLQPNIEVELRELEKITEELLIALDKNDQQKLIRTFASIIGMPSAFAQVNLTELDKGKGGKGNLLSDVKQILLPAISTTVTLGPFRDKFLGQVFTTPAGRGAFSVALGVYSSIVSVDSFKKAKNAKERIEAIEEIKKTIKNSPTTVAGCTVADRKDRNKPACYCYNENNEPNLARSNQQVCTTQWGDPSIAGLTDYNQNGTISSNEKVCLSSTYKVDESCTCRGQKGQNGCLQFGNIAGFNDIGASSYGNSLRDLANQVTSGTYSSGDALATAGNNLAMKGKQIVEQMAKQSPEANKALKGIRSQATKLQGAHMRAMGGNNLAMRSPLDTQPLGNIDPKKAAAEVEKSIAEAQAYEQGQAKKQASTSSDNNMNFDFGGNGSGGSIIVEDDMNEVMNKDFDYAENDINNRPGDSIFSILTLRYQTSGLRRLFDDKNEFQAEAASGNEIHGN